MSSWTGSATPDLQQQTRSASLGYISARASSLCNARNASILGSDSTSISSGRMQSIRRQMSLTLRRVSTAQQCTCEICNCLAVGSTISTAQRAFTVCLLAWLCSEVCSISSSLSWSAQDNSLQQPLSLASLGRHTSVWGWLEAVNPSMPHVLLEGAGVAMGRSREAFETRRHALSVACSTSPGLPDPSPVRRYPPPCRCDLSPGWMVAADGGTFAIFWSATLCQEARVWNDAPQRPA